MQLGVDFGTTRTIVAAVDRGNYPVVSFLDEDADAHDYYPSVAALTDDGLVYGFAAVDAARAGAPMVRSFKRLLASPHVSSATPVPVGDETFPVGELLTGFLSSLRTALLERSSVSETGIDEEDRTVVAVPAHAHGAQRFLTLDAFRRAGFTVWGMVNEPSAAGFEYTHRQGHTVSSRRTRVIVYDLGGGTFDASLVHVEGRSHEVLDSLGLNALGGDDFDVILARAALAEAGDPDLEPRAWAQLLEECREAKEHLSPQSKRMAVEVDGRPVVVRVEDFYRDAVPLVEQTVEAMRPLVGGLDGADPVLTDIAGIYLVGGASGLPLVPRLLRERFGRRVHRAPLPAASTAIGLAIAADPDAGYSLTDRLSRGFGVFRERSNGLTVSFDPLLPRDQILHMDHAVTITRRYLAAHNIGWFRFVEYASVDADGEPRGDIVPFAEVAFPFDPALRAEHDLRAVPVERRGHGPLIEETYTVDPHGIIEVTITDLESGYTRTSTLQAGAAEL